MIMIIIIIIVVVELLLLFKTVAFDGKLLHVARLLFQLTNRY